MVSVFHFGAVGDGQADDTEALQHALEAGDGVLELDKGTYRIRRTLVIDLTRQGYGAVLGRGGAGLRGHDRRGRRLQRLQRHPRRRRHVG